MKEKPSTEDTTQPKPKQSRQRKASPKLSKEAGPKRRASRSPPFAAWPDWSEAKFWAFVRSGLRAKSARWPAKYTVKALAKRAYSGTNPRQKFEYLCAKCSNYYPDKEVTVDHIIPVGTLTSFEDLPKFVELLFCGIDGLQCLCDTCHQIKTNAERAARKDETLKST